MPIYEYRCTICGTAFEVLLPRGSGAPPCQGCGTSAVERRISRLAAVVSGDCAPSGSST